MPEHTDNTAPLVSVIIPCYNHGRYLEEALGSIRQQNYPAVEVVVVDDGSTDNTREFAEKLTGVIYVYQQNSGLSAARNTGIKNSSGEYLVFLDADDWLYPGAIGGNARYMLENPEIAFVSGDYDYVENNELKIFTDCRNIAADHYIHMLWENYIGMIATVMFRRRVFEEFLFDTTLKNCEDYDLYLKITRKFPVMHHPQKIAVYRFHSSNMSNNIPAMLRGVQKVLKRQRYALQNDAEKLAYARGHSNWKSYYSRELLKALRARKAKPSLENFLILIRYRPVQLLKFLARKYAYMFLALTRKAIYQ